MIDIDPRTWVGKRFIAVCTNTIGPAYVTVYGVSIELNAVAYGNIARFAMPRWCTIQLFREKFELFEDVNV